jgi:DNA-directed RNA polymerase subunit RPC12/RpoP
MAASIEVLMQAANAMLAPIDTRTVCEWCEDEVMLTERQTQSPGHFSTDLTPYLREPLECFGDVDVSDLVLVFGTQTGKTTMVQAGTAWRIVNKPQPVVWVMPTEGLARSFSETRWLPLFEDSATLREQIPSDRHKFKNLEQHFSRCSAVFIGSNSPANLSSRPAGLLLMDEVDKFAKETDSETSALFLAENRTKSFVGALRVKTSTPTTPDGAIWQEYLKGTQEKFMLECPHCHDRIELLWEQVKWDATAKEAGKWNMALVEDSAHYLCQRCGGEINDGQKMEMLAEGKWAATNPTAQRGFRSFHLNSLYAPWRSCTFGALAVKFLRDKDTINGLHGDAMGAGRNLDRRFKDFRTLRRLQCRNLPHRAPRRRHLCRHRPGQTALGNDRIFRKWRVVCHRLRDHSYGGRPFTGSTTQEIHNAKRQCRLSRMRPHGQRICYLSRLCRLSGIGWFLPPREGQQRDIWNSDITHRDR